MDVHSVDHSPIAAPEHTGPTYKVRSNSLLPGYRLVLPERQHSLDILAEPAVPPQSLWRRCDLFREGKVDFEQVCIRGRSVRVSKHDGDEGQVDFGRSEREEDSEDIVDSWVRVDYDFAGHYVYLFSMVRVGEYESCGRVVLWVELKGYGPVTMI